MKIFSNLRGSLPLRALLSGLLVAALIVGWTGGPRAVELGLEIAALLVGAYTFVPSTLKRLAKGKIGVGTLMTIAAVGAVLLNWFFNGAPHADEADIRRAGHAADSH